MKILINNEEVLSNKNFTIKEEMLNTSSVILNNVYPKSWEQTKDYTSQFYYPKDYSKCKIIEEEYHPAQEGIYVEGTNLTLTDVDTTKLNELTDLKGNTTQETTTGKNLIDITTLQQGYVNSSGTISPPTGGEEMYSTFIKVNPNTQYTFKIIKTASTIQRWIGIGEYSSNSYSSFIKRNTISLSDYLTFITTSTTQYVVISARNLVQATQIQLEKGSQATPYEEYTGGQPSPNPTYPQPINVVSGRQEVSVCGKNLFNYNLFDTFTTTIKYVSLTLKPNTQYTMSSNIPITSGVGTNLFFMKNGETASTSANGVRPETPRTLTTDSTGIVKVGYRTGTGVSENPKTDYWYQIEKGSTTSDYEEFKGQSYEINLGKNLFNINDFFSKHQSITIENNSIILGNVVYQPIVYVLRIENNKNYTISFNSSTTNVYRLQVKDSDSSGTSGTTLLNKSITSLSYSGNFTTTSEYIRIEFFQSTSTETQIISNIQLEKGSQATSYSPYKTPIELCKIGTYQDRIYKENGTWYLHKEIGKVVLNGSELWQGNNNYFFSTAIDNYALWNSYQNYSNYFKSYNKRMTPATVVSEDSLSVGGGNATDVLKIRIKLVSMSISTANDFKTWLSTHNTIVYYVLATPTTTEITDTELISQLESIELLEGLNNISITSAYLPGTIRLHYNYTNEQIIETLLFCGIVKNTGNISLNPREPHYCSLQILDFKNFLSQGETLDFVIANKTILEAIEQIISTISGYGFVLGNVDILGSYDMIGAYSTKDKTAYDVFNYIADITQSRWTTRMINENQVAIDFYDPTLMPEGTAIEYTKEWFETNNINDMSFSYSSNDYRNKQVMTSSEVYGNMEQQETKTADGYNTQFFTEQKIGKINQIVQNNVQKTFATDDEKAVGVIADFYYTPGENYFESAENVSVGDTIIIQYIPIVEGRQIITNSTEIDRINSLTGRKGIIARYETRNDATTSQELQKIGQSYIKYKGIPEIKLKIETLNNIWNIGDRVQFNAPLEELTTEYMVKSKEINYITTIDDVFYKYTLTSSFNSESDINYFDNQRSKANGNIGAGEYVSRNVDIENVGNIIFYDYSVEEIEITGDNTLNSVLNAPFIN